MATTEAQVTVTGTPENPVFNFVLPSGGKGEPGGWNGGVALTSQDLNTVRTPGLYYRDIVGVPTDKNYPPIKDLSGSSRLEMMVRPWSAGTGATVQEITTIGQRGAQHVPPVKYIRHSNGEEWSPWRTFTAQRIDNTAGRAIYTWDDVNNREQLIYGDTGWRNIGALVPTLTSGNLYYRRSMYSCEAVFENVILSDAVGASVALVIPNSSAVLTGYLPLMSGNLSAPLHVFEYGWSGTHRINKTSTAGFKGAVSWTTASAWPTSLPGTAVGSIPNL